MKKFVLFAAVAGVALAGCAKVEKTVTGEPGNVPIVFEPVANNLATKAVYYGEQNATYTGGATPTYEEFKAWGFYTTGATSTTNPQNTSLPEASGKEYFAGIVCSHEGTAPNDYWKTGYYWPYQSTTDTENGYMHFHAFSPAVLSPCTGDLGHTWAEGFTLNDFVATNNMNEQVDLLYSNFVFNAQRKNYDPNPGMPYDESTDDVSYAHKGVNLVFNHALSSINIKLKTDKDYSANHTFHIKTLKVENVLKGGTFHENVTTDATGNYQNVATPNQNQVTKNKNNTAGQSPYWTPTITDPTGNANDAITYTLIDSSTEVTKDEKSAGNAILAVPQVLEHNSYWSAIEDVEISGTFDYTFKIDSNNYVTLTDVPFAKTLSGVTGTYSDSSTYNGEYWLINHRYTYTLNFKLDEIIFDPKVLDWIYVTVNVDLP